MDSFNENKDENKFPDEEVNTNTESPSSNAEQNRSNATNEDKFKEDKNPSSEKNLKADEILKKKMELFGEWNCTLGVTENQENYQVDPAIIKFNIRNITDSLFEKDEFVNGGSIIKFNENFYEGNDANKFFISHISNENFSYTGYLNKYLQKNVFGIHKFSNKNLYIGEWRENKKDGFGAYFYSPDQNEFLIGDFVDNSTGKNGFYYRDYEDNTGFEAFLGSFVNDELLEKGTFLGFKNEKDGYIYQGEFKDNKKHDETGYYYDLGNEIVFRGKFENDKMLEGYIFELISGFNIKSVIHYNHEGKKTPLGRDQIDQQIKNVEKFLSDLEKIDFINICKNISHGVFELKKESEAEGFMKDQKLEDLHSGLGKLERLVKYNQTIINV